MAHAHSYQITLSNNKTEKEALSLLLAERDDLLIPDAKGRKAILEALGIDKRFRRTFDLVRIPGHRFGESQVEIQNPGSITLFEIKSTKKLLPDFPKGFFFGATANEFDLAKRCSSEVGICLRCFAEGMNEPEAHQSPVGCVSRWCRRIRHIQLLHL